MKRGAISPPFAASRPLRPTRGQRGLKCSRASLNNACGCPRSLSDSPRRSFAAWYLAGRRASAQLCDFIAENDPLAIPILLKCITHKSGYEHVLALGTTGSGKTTVINQIMKDGLWHVGRGYGHGAVILDIKRTARRYLARLPLKVPVYYLDPADAGSHGIDWPRQLDTAFAAKEFAKLAVHAEADKGGHNYVFTANARSVLYHVIRTFILFARYLWDLIDVVEACRSQRTSSRCCPRHPAGRQSSRPCSGPRGRGRGYSSRLRSS